MKIQIDDTVREATQDEIALIELVQSTPTIEEQIISRKAAAESARAKLAALGLTEAEIKALVG